MNRSHKRVFSLALATFSILLSVSLSGFSPAQAAQGGSATAAQDSSTPATQGSSATTAQDSSAPVVRRPQAPLKIIDIEAGWGYSMALRSDGTVWVWGNNESGIAGDGTLGVRYSKKADNIRTRPTLVMGNVKSIGGTYGTCYAITNDNSLWVWGFSYGGRIGNGSTNYDCSLPVKILSDVKVVASGNSNHSAVIKNDGTLWVWGLNIDGQLLNGNENPQMTPHKIMDGVQTVASGEGHLMVLKGSGDLYVWGRNWKGQLGDGTGKDRLTPFKLKSNVKKIYAGSNQSYFITKDGVLWGAGKDFTGRFSKPVKLLTSVTDVNGSPSNYVAIKTDGTLWAWGENECGAFGDGTTNYKYKPVKIMSNVAKAAAGDDHFLVLKKDGTLWASGRNDRGQLGVGDTKNRTRFVQITGLTTADATAASARLQLTISLDGNLAGWKGIEPVGSDPAGDVADGKFDITDLYAARDEKYLYIGLKATGIKPDLDINIDTDGDDEGEYTALCYVDDRIAFIDDESNKAKGHAGIIPLGYNKAVELKIPLAMLKNPESIQISANYNKDDNGNDPDRDWMNEWFEVQ
ncbi:MAG TPA: hypothetical protein VHT96_13300 [Clostridia bacterium]|nr:hypothetical protein [Clostridia bacterium]